MGRLFIGFVVTGVLFSVSWITAQDGSGDFKRPLDLPSGGLGEEEEDETGPETITFYGASYEGDGFFWCLDKSCSMGWGGEIQTLKQEVSQAVQSLSSNSEFGLVAFSTTVSIWKQLPAQATPPNKVSALAWIQGIGQAGWTCLEPAGIQTLQIANQSSKQFKKVLVLGDGVPICNGQDTSSQCLTNITAANWQSLPIDTLYISADTQGINFMQQLAAMNNGTFVLVE